MRGTHVDGCVPVWVVAKLRMTSWRRLRYGSQDGVHSTHSFWAQARSLREFVPKDLRGKGRVRGWWGGMHGTDDFATADDFSRRQSTNFWGQDEINFQLGSGLNNFLGPEQHSRTADVFRGSFAPAAFTYEAVFQRNVYFF